MSSDGYDMVGWPLSSSVVQIWKVQHMDSLQVGLLVHNYHYLGTYLYIGKAICHFFVLHL